MELTAQLQQLKQGLRGTWMAGDWADRTVR